MFGAIRKLATVLQGPRAVTPSAPDESRGKQLILSDPVRRDILVQLKNLQIGIPQDERSALVDPVLIRFAHYVVDLPASERNHDSRPYGLLDHSLAVGLAATRQLVRPSFRSSEDPTINHREQPIWAYAGFLLGLLHDAGKVFDLEVILKDRIPAWDPLSGPLSTFLEQHGRDASGPDSWRWIKGRGNGHVDKLADVAPRLIPPRSKIFLGRRWEDLLAVFQASYKTGKEDWRRGPAGRVAAAVRNADEELAAAAMPAEGSQQAEVAGGSEVVTANPTAPTGDAQTMTSIHPANAASTDAPSVSSDEKLSTKALAQAPSASPCPPAVNSTGKSQGAQKKPFHLRQISVRDDRIESEMKPDKILEAVRSLLRAGNISRNSRRAELFVRQDYIWLKYPEALKRLFEEKNITWSSKLSDRLEHELLKLSHIATENPKSPLVYAFLEPRDKDSMIFVRLSTKGLLPEEELANLGYWPHEMRIQPTAIPHQKQLPFRAMPGGKV